MVVLSKPAIEHFSATRNCKPTKSFPTIPLIDLSKPNSKSLLVDACEEFGFFKVINHGVPLEFISKLETEAIKFFSLPFPEKQKAGHPSPFGYGNKNIGLNGDIGWVEYLLMKNNPDIPSPNFLPVLAENGEIFW